MITIVDFGMGNLRSVAQAIGRVAPQSHCVISDRPEDVQSAGRIVLPGQGAMRDCLANLRDRHLEAAVREALAAKPVLGVCIGEQMLFERSEESDAPGLGVLAGDVARLTPAPEASGRPHKVPHMGWNTVRQVRAHPLWDGIGDGSYFYFVHSYHVRPARPELVFGETDYGGSFTSAVAQDNIFAVQFHPEKSAHAGLRLYENFLKWNP